MPKIGGEFKRFLKMPVLCSDSRHVKIINSTDQKKDCSLHGYYQEG